MSFSNFPLRPELLKAIDALNFHEPTPIQSEAIPAVLSGRDLLASAQTGTGKTLAFMLPLLHSLLEARDHLKMRPSVPSPLALVLLPTRELAAQVEGVAREVGRFSNVKSALLVGGESFHRQLEALRRGATLVIATPGRLLDHLERRTISLSQVKALALDEADHMLDMGFAPALKAILSYLPKERQTMLFSATLPSDVTQLSHLALSNPVSIRMTPQAAPASTITQHVYPVLRGQKNDLLLAILRTMDIHSVIIFCRTKRGVDHLTRFLHTEDLSVECIHSDRTMGQRKAALQGFKSGRYKILVATDIAARGIDVKKLSHVINYDVPNYVQDYVHRIGRTGRIFEVGDALTLVSPDEYRQVQAIERFIGRSIPRVELPDFPYQQLPPPPKPKSAMDHFAKRRKFIPRGRFSRFSGRR